MVSSRPNDLTPADRATDLAPGARTGHVRVQAAVVSSGLSCSDLIGERMPIELWRRVRLWNTSIQSKTSVESSTREFLRVISGGGGDGRLLGYQRGRGPGPRSGRGDDRTRASATWRS